MEGVLPLGSPELPLKAEGEATNAPPRVASASSLAIICGSLETQIANSCR